LNTIQKLYKKCIKSESNFIYVSVRYLLIKLKYRKNLLLHQDVSIKGLKNLEVNKRLYVGLNYTGFNCKNDKTFLNIQGQLIIQGDYSIGRGCRFDIGKNAVVEIGEGGYINSNSLLIIQHSLKIGKGCAISWNCQILDDDFHQIDYTGKKTNLNNSIEIGDNVWIGCGVKIYKGSFIPEGCVVAADSVIKGRFPEKNCLIGGHPAKILKQNVKWN